MSAGTAFILIAESKMRADYLRTRRIPAHFWLLHVGTARKPVRQYRPQMAGTGRASSGALHRTVEYRPLAALLHQGRIFGRDAQSLKCPPAMGDDRRHGGRR